MTRLAMPFSMLARRLTAGSLLLALPGLAAAQDDNLRDREPDVGDVASTPVSDLNLSRDEIPAILVAAKQDMYASAAAGDCREIGEAIAALDAVLGPDFDVEADKRDRISEGRIATSVVGSLIPFRGIVREVTGAAEHRRQFEAAITAGMIRRGYLKGLGETKGCPYPARPAFTRVEIDYEGAEPEAAE